MVSKLLNEAILKGPIDYYCLVCESHFKNELALYGHVLNPKHKSNVNAVGFVDKYKNHQIRKVKKGYFCEICNELIHTVAKVGIHLDNEQHVKNKGVMLLKRVDGNVAYEHVNIDDKAWNGMIEETCMLCNIEFDNAEIHKSETSHKLNLVQCDIEIGVGGVIYRKVDDTSFHCLPCNKVFSTTIVGTHFETEEHKQKCLKPTPKVSVKPVVPTINNTIVTNVDVKEKKEEKSKTVNKNESTKRRLRPPPTTVNIEKPFPVRVVSYEYELLICALLKANSYIVQLDDMTMRCLVCEKQMANMAVKLHLEHPDHIYLFKLHRKRLEKYDEMEQLEVETDILASMEEFQNNNIAINLNKKTAICQICFDKLDFLADIIHEHIDHHRQLAIKKESELKEKAAKKAAIKLETAKKAAAKYEKYEAAKKTAAKLEASKEIVTKSASQADIPQAIVRQQTPGLSKFSCTMTDIEKEEWAIEHNITFNRFQNTAYCNVCNSKLPTSEKNLKEHVSGNAHRNLMAKSLTKDIKMSIKSQHKCVKVSSKMFIKSFKLYENFMFQLFVINEKFVISYKSMSFLKKTVMGFLRCFLCDEEIVDGATPIETHRTTRKHSSILENVPVIVSLDSEFVREIPSGELHCGYCNIVEKNLADLQKHFTKVEHKENRCNAEWRLIEFNSKRKF